MSCQLSPSFAVPAKMCTTKTAKTHLASPFLPFSCCFPPVRGAKRGHQLCFGTLQVKEFQKEKQPKATMEGMHHTNPPVTAATVDNAV